MTGSSISPPIGPPYNIYVICSRLHDLCQGADQFVLLHPQRQTRSIHDDNIGLPAAPADRLLSHKPIDSDSGPPASGVSTILEFDQQAFIMKPGTGDQHRVCEYRRHKLQYSVSTVRENQCGPPSPFRHARHGDDGEKPTTKYSGSPFDGEPETELLAVFLAAIIPARPHRAWPACLHVQRQPVKACVWSLQLFRSSR